METKFLELDRFNRYQYMLKNSTSEPIYELLAKHLSGSIDYYKRIVNIDVDRFRCTITFNSSDTEMLFDLFQYLIRFGIKFESITETCLITSLNEFIDKIL